MLKLPPPDPFDFSRPGSWPEWKTSFGRYRLATKLNHESDDVQIATLLYTLGKEAERIFESFGLTPEEQNNLTLVFEKFDSYFIPKRNTIHERANFHQCIQSQSQNVENFIRTLYEKAEHCNFANKDESIRDQLVFGLKDKNVSKQLQLESELTLPKAIEMARNHESVDYQINQQKEMNIDAVSNSRDPDSNKPFRQSNFNNNSSSHFQRTSRTAQYNSRGGSHSNFRDQNSRGGAFSQFRGGRSSSGAFPHFRGGLSQNFTNCPRCGGTHLRYENCPAFGKMCNFCHKQNHFANVCRQRIRQRSVNEITDHTIEDSHQFDDFDHNTQQEIYINSIESPSNDPWKINIKINDNEIPFKIDTGAEVTVISTRQYNKMRPRPALHVSKIRLNSPGGKIKCLGGFWGTIEHKKMSVREQIYVIETDSENLLGRKTITSLNLVNRIDEVIDAAAFGDITPVPIKCRPVRISLKEENTPYNLSTPRRVPIPIMKKVKDELQRMKELGVIEEITEPTDWCSPMVPVIKKNGAVRICADFKNLNKYIKRERYVMPTIDDILHKLSDTQIYSKLDLSSGFWQIPLDSETAKLTTFITPFGRYFYKRLPFGISSAPEIFQRTMSEILKDDSNSMCYMDDILIYSDCPESHEKHIKDVLKTLKEAGVKLSKDKCEFRKTKIKFLGYSIDSTGIKPDPEKVSAIMKLKTPSGIHELRRMLGMIQYLARYIPNVTNILQPLYDLLVKDRAWIWGPLQQKAFENIKARITTAPTLLFYNPDRETRVSADASSYGLGALLSQKDDDGNYKPIAYASRTLNSAEKNYAQLEKECLAITWACERFERYLVGLDHFVVLSDHKPLVPIINNKNIPDTPIRCQRMLIRLMRFNLTVIHTAGKNLIVADALSRSPISETETETNNTRDNEIEVEAHVNAVTKWPTSDHYLERIRRQTENDPILKNVLKYVVEGWPEFKADVALAARNYFPIRGELSYWEGILTKGDLIVVPLNLREETLEQIHSGHFGVTKCKERARQAVWWPGIATDIIDKIAACTICIEKLPSHRKEPLMPTEIPDRPYQKIGTDLFEIKGKHYIVIVDYYSKNLDIEKLPNQSSVAVIERLKRCFALNGIPESVVSDNGPCFHSSEFQEFAAAWNFQHVTSSPRHPQSNGQAESAVKIAKQILHQDDPYLALMIYRSTPVQSTGLSPAELCLGRKIRTNLPILPCKLLPKTEDPNLIQKKCTETKNLQKEYFDRHHGTRNLPTLQRGDRVFVKVDNNSTWSLPGTILEEYSPRSYVVQTSKGTVRRNRIHLKLATTSNRPQNQLIHPRSSTPFDLPPTNTSATPFLSTPTNGTIPTLNQCSDPEIAFSTPPSIPPIPLRENTDQLGPVIPTPEHSCQRLGYNSQQIRIPMPHTSPIRHSNSNSHQKFSRSGRLIKPPIRFGDYE